MKHKIILEVDGVRHKLIKTKSKRPCETCSIADLCKENDNSYCEFKFWGTHYRKCKSGE